MRFYERYLDWRRSGPPTTRAAVVRVVVRVVVMLVVGTVVMGVLNLADGQDSAGAWVDAVEWSVPTVALMGLFVAAVVYADRHHRRQVRATETGQDSETGGADGSGSLLDYG